jgi:AcrR family transcriptional regulator
MPDVWLEKSNFCSIFCPKRELTGSSRMVQKTRNAEILQTAARVFRQKGFHAARIQDIADELGMRKGSLYHYISSKEDLIKGLAAGALERMIEETGGILDTGHLARRKLAMAIEAHLRLTLEDRDIWGLLMHENLELLNRNSPADIRALVRQYEALWDRLVAEGVASGEFDPNLDPRVVVQALLAICTGFLDWFRPDGRLPVREVARIFAEMSLRGIQSAPEAAGED